MPALAHLKLLYPEESLAKALAANLRMVHLELSATLSRAEIAALLSYLNSLWKPLVAAPPSSGFRRLSSSALALQLRIGLEPRRNADGWRPIPPRTVEFCHPAWS